MIKLCSVHNNKFSTLLGKTSLQDLSRDRDYSWLKATKGNTRQIYKAQTKKDLAIKIFIDFLEIMLEDVIKNGNVFRLPSKLRTFIYVGEDWKDRESNAINPNLFSLKPQYVLKISTKCYGRVITKMCIVKKELFRYIQEYKDKYKLDPSSFLESW